MSATQLIAARVTRDTKLRFRALAEQQQLTESGMLKRMIELTLRSVDVAGHDPPQIGRQMSPQKRLSVRLRGEDQLLLRERAAARQMAVATYVSLLVRVHLRSISPLPKPELVALKHSVAELAAIGRNLNQIARAINQGARPAAPQREDLRAFLNVCEGLRDNMKNLIRANLRSWEIGHAEPEN
jgi:hypothetical protein